MEEAASDGGVDLVPERLPVEVPLEVQGLSRSAVADLVKKLVRPQEVGVVYWQRLPSCPAMTVLRARWNYCAFFPRLPRLGQNSVTSRRATGRRTVAGLVMAPTLQQMKTKILWNCVAAMTRFPFSVCVARLQHSVAVPIDRRWAFLAHCQSSCHESRLEHKG